jgi:ATP-binding cassette subfamily B protein
MKRPPVFAGDRVASFVRLVANGLLQVGTVLAAGLLAAQLLAPAAGRATWPTATLLVLCAVLLFALRWRERIDAARLAQSYVHELRSRMFARLWHAHAREALRRGRGALLLRLMGDMGAIGRWVGHGLARIVVTAALIAGICVALLWIAPWLAAVALALVALSGAAGLAIRGPLDAAVRGTRAARGRLATAAADRLQALAAIQASGTWRAEQARLEDRSRAVAGATIAETRWSAGLLSGSEMIGLLAPSLAIVAAALLGGAQESLANAPTIVALFGLLVTPLRDSVRVFDYWRKARIAHEKVEQVLNMPRLPRPRVSPPVSIGTVDELAVQGVSLRAGGPPLDLRATRGARVQLRGRPGSGRTALLRMLVRLTDPPAGTVTVNGHDVRDVDLAELRSRVALVSTALGLQRGVLQRLLTRRRPRATPDEIDAVLRRCGVREAVAGLRDGLATQLAEGWPELSVALRFRLLCAQALLADPDVLLLDDLDFALPPAQSDQLLAMLAGFSGIVVLVSSQTRWRSWASTVWAIGDAAPVSDDVLRNGLRLCDTGR